MTPLQVSEQPQDRPPPPTVLPMADISSRCQMSLPQTKATPWQTSPADARRPFLRRKPLDPLQRGQGLRGWQHHGQGVGETRTLAHPRQEPTSLPALAHPELPPPASGAAWLLTAPCPEPPISRCCFLLGGINPAGPSARGSPTCPTPGTSRVLPVRALVPSWSPHASRFAPCVHARAAHPSSWGRPARPLH